MRRDVRRSETWQAVEESFRRLHEPSFGRPSALLEVVVSRTGEVVAAVGVRTSLDGVGQTRLARVADGELHLVTAGPHNDGAPRWSPDGRSLAFLSDRAERGVMQPYVLVGSELGEARRVATLDGIAESLDWSPDGTRLLLGVAGHGADRAAAEGSGTTEGEDADDRPAWLPEVEHGTDTEQWRSAWVVDVASGDARQVSPDGLNIWECAWAGDDAIVAVTSEAPGEGAWYSSVLTRVELGSGSPVGTAIVRTDVQLGLPAASPDGERVSVVEAVASDRGFLAGDLLVHAAGATTRIDALGVDVTSHTWLDGSRLGFCGVRGLDSVAGVHDVDTGRTAELWCSPEAFGGQRGAAAEFLPDGGLVAILQGYRRPPEVVRVDEGRVTTLATTRSAGTDDLSSVAGSVEAVSWTAPDGLQVEGLLVTPAGDGPFPLLVNVHGGPIWSYRDRWCMGYALVPVLASRGYAVLHPNPRGSTGRGRAFAAAVVGDMGGADTDDLRSGIDALVERGIADPDRIGVLGGSYGGFMASWLVTRDERFKAAVSVAPVNHWRSMHYTSNIPEFAAVCLAAEPSEIGGRYDERSPLHYADRVTTPVLHIAGALDRCTPAGQAVEFHRALVERGVESALVVYPQEGHGVRAFPATIDLVTRIVDWFERFMPAGR